MHPILSIIIAIAIIVLALRLVLKATGCLVKLVVFVVALGFILMILNVSFHFLGSIFGIFF